MGYVFINLPLHLALSLYPAWLPFHFHVSTNFLMLALDLLLLQLVVPHVLAHVQIDALATQAARLWLAAAGTLTGLTDYLLPAQD